MSILLDILAGVFRGAVELFTVEADSSSSGALWAIRLGVVAVICVAAGFVWLVSGPVRWVGVPLGLAATLVGLVAELKYR